MTNGDIGFCVCKSCSIDEGPCFHEKECQGDLACGIDNCPISHPFSSLTNCCTDQLSRRGRTNRSSLINLRIKKELVLQIPYVSDEILHPPHKVIMNEILSKIQAKSRIGQLNLNQHVLQELLMNYQQRNKVVFEEHDNVEGLFKGIVNIKSKTLQNMWQENMKYFYSTLHIQNMKRLKRKKVFKKSSSQSIVRKVKSNFNTPTKLRHSHIVSSKFGLSVLLNTNEAEYGNALKNNFVGFKTLVHTPYDFAEVDAIGMAMDKNIQSYIGIRGYHSWTTDAANELNLFQKKCLSRFDDVTKYPKIRLNLFSNYTQKGCILECYANLIYDQCGCLPYHYPDFFLVWKVNTTCDYKGLKCLSTVNGIYNCLIC